MDQLTTKDWITIGISVIALLISIINFIRDRKHVALRISKQGLIKRIETFDCEPAFPNQRIGVSIDFRFLNTSKHSLGYYDLVFRDGYTKQLLPCTYKYAFRPEIATQELLGITIDEQTAHLNLMNSNYGIIPSNSYVFKEVIVYPLSDKIRVNIKFAQNTLLINPYSKTTKFKKWKSKLIKLSSEEVAILRKQSVQDLSEERTSQ
ncbi:hypothetical protein [Enterococcus avium]|uniref:hypothetical protein n=1 Tax=Enterococcus avium TaxID=33945 RepID=UPI0034A1FA5F